MFLTIAAIVLLTSTVSGAIGMGGGMILMGALTFVMASSHAFIWHGFIQMTANGSRAVTHRKEIQWRIVGTYLIGSVGAIAMFASQKWLAPTWVIFLILGLSPGVRYLPRINPSCQTKWGAIVCGFVVTAGQFLAGASGPLLDIFFVDTTLSRQQIVATKAFTQTLGHGAKILYFAFIIDTALTYTEYVNIVLVSTCAPIGTLLGKKILEKMSNTVFRRISAILINTIGLVFLGKALSLLWAF